MGMTIALWIIAICEVIRTIQNSMQLLHFKKSEKRSDSASGSSLKRISNKNNGRSARNSTKKSLGGIVMAIKRIKFDSWPELLEAVKDYDDKGIKTEINGFDDLSENILTVYGEIEHEYTKRNNAC